MMERKTETHHSFEPAGRRVRLAWSLAAVATAVAGLLLWQATVLRRQASTAQRLLEATVADNSSLRSEISSHLAELGKYQDAIVLGEPGLRFVRLDRVYPGSPALGIVVTRPDKSAGILYVYRFPIAPADQEYQLWGLRDELPSVSLGTFIVGDDGAAVLNLPTIPQSTHIVGYSVSIEPKGGASQPTGKVHIRGMDLMEPMKVMNR